jgi:hypothetical protein
MAKNAGGVRPGKIVGAATFGLKNGPEAPMIEGESEDKSREVAPCGLRSQYSVLVSRPQMIQDSHS